MDASRWDGNEIKESAPTAKRQLQNLAQDTLQILESISDPLFSVDSNWNITYVNKAAGRLIFEECPEPLGIQLWSAISEMVGTAYYVQCYFAMVGRIDVRFDLFHPRLGRWFDARISPCGEGISSYLRDVTDRKQATEALRSSEKQFRDLFESSPTGIYRTTPDGRILMVNPAMVTMLGYDSEEELTSLTVEEGAITSNEDRATFKARLENEGVIKNSECIWQKKDGTQIVVRETARAVRGDDGRIEYYEGMANDVTEQREMKERIDRFQRLEAAGRVAGQVAHDFNNLLAPLVAYPDLVRNQLPKGHPAIQFCDAMQESAERMVEINDDLMAMGRRGQLVAEPADLNDLVRKSIDELRAPAATLEIVLDLDDAIPPVLGSSAQLMRVLSNLLSNARDAMADVGTLTVRTESCHVPRPTGNYNRVEKGDYVRLTVSDTGTGIPEEILGRIFDAFYTTKRSNRRGCGLGLSVVQAIVEDHNGFLDLETAHGLGTTFTVYLPMASGSAHLSEGREPRGKAERVLIIDDDPMQREVVRLLLLDLGYQAETASSGETALAMMQEERFDILILDMVMPEGMDGAETYRRILKIRPDQKALVASGYADSARVKEAKSLGIGTFLRKPLTREVLALAIRAELDKSQ